jgi:murein DD-endopeptidase MepM/ murein hydrolase activator NlpD
MKLDSLENLYLAQSNYIKSLKNILSGNISFDDINEDTGASETNQVELELIKTNKEDSLLRALVDEEDKYNAFELEGDRFTTVLFPPVKGDLSSEFDYENKHYGVDIAMPENSPVHSISEGIVVFAEWTSETGFVIIAEHLNGLTSIYKHNSSIVKAQGDIIQTGEIIAFTGNTGSLTTGPHLHFELWYQGEPVDPENYIEF